MDLAVSPTVLYYMIKWSSLTSEIYEFCCFSNANFKFCLSSVGGKEYVFGGEQLQNGDVYDSGVENNHKILKNQNYPSL